MPHETLGRLNKELCARWSGRVVTALYCLADEKNRKIQAVSAGHGPVLVYRHQNKTIEEIPLKGSPPLGVMDDSIYDSVTFSMQPNDECILFSDGCTEARDLQGNEFGIDRIKTCILENAGISPQKTLESLKKSLSDFFYKSQQYDDITVIVLTLD